MAQAKHTPTPWKHNCLLGTNGKDTIFHCGGMLKPVAARAEEAEANAAFIVKAVNCHEKLMEALAVAKAELEQHKDVPGVSEHILPCIEAALAAAEASHA